MSNVTNIDHYRGGQQPAQVRPLPASIENEQMLLGAILINAEAYHQAATIVRIDDFAEEIHRRIFDVMGQLLRAERRITPASLLEYLGNHDVAEGLDTQHYLAHLSAAAVTVLNAPEYARIIHDHASRRKLIGAAQKITDAAHDPRIDVSPEQIATDGLSEIRTIVEDSPRQNSRFHLGTGMADLVERMERMRAGEEKPAGISTGFADLDRVTGGLQPGTIVFACGRPGMGKTVMMTNLGFNVARDGIGVLEFSLEIPADQLQARHLAQAAYHPRNPVPFSCILNGQLDDRSAEEVILAQRSFMKLPIVVECPPTITATEIAARIHVEKKRLAALGIKLGVVLIDYLDKIRASDRYAGQRTYELQEIITVLKSAALADDVCIVLLAQLNRGTEGREDKRPSLADLKSSSFIEQEAHAIIFIYREAYYLQKSADYRNDVGDAKLRFQECQHDVELILGKNRGGPEETVRLWGDVACSVLASQERWRG